MTIYIIPLEFVLFQTFRAGSFVIYKCPVRNLNVFDQDIPK
jgi:hypothetical protein